MLNFLNKINSLHLLVFLQVVLVAIGIQYLNFGITWMQVFVIVAVSIITELIFCNALRWRRGERVRMFFPFSAVAAGLGIAIFFRTLNPFIFALTAFVAISSKYLLRWRGGHIFNPSNIGMLLIVMLFPHATTIEFTQWGGNAMFFTVLTIIALSIAYYAKALVTTISFLISYGLLVFIGSIYGGSYFEVHHYGLIGPSILLFASFMITDPKTSPQDNTGRVLHGISITFLFAVLELIGVRYSLFFASFIATILNFISARGVDFLEERKLFISPKNIGALVIAVCAFVPLFIPVVVRNIEQGPTVLSPEFLLLGVEASTREQCSAQRAFADTQIEGIDRDLATATSGTAWGDFNNDGFDDLFVSNINAPSVLYQNNGDGTFTDVTHYLLSDKFSATSAVFSDYDNDGLLDLFVAYPEDLPKRPVPVTKFGGEMPVQAVRVYRNSDGAIPFVNTTKEIGLADFKLPKTTGGFSVADYDNNGYLDFVFTSLGRGMLPYALTDVSFWKAVRDPRFNRTSWLLCGETEVQEVLGTIRNSWGKAQQLEYLDPNVLEDSGLCVIATYELNAVELEHATSAPHSSRLTSARFILPGEVRLFKNSGGVFTVSDEFNESMKKSLPLPDAGVTHTERVVDFQSEAYFQPISFDFDNDGDMDIFLAIDIGSNVLLENMGDFKFKDVTEDANVNIAGTGMGVDVSDYDNDGDFDVLVSNKYQEYLFQNKGDGTFENVFPRDRIGMGWGISFLDYNLDGKDDVFIVNGDESTTPVSYEPLLNLPLFRANALYENTGTGFLRSTPSLCPDLQSGRSLAISDYDNDGDPDAFVGNFGGAATSEVELRGNVAPGNQMYVNQNTDGNYIKIRLQGTLSNSMGVGAVVAVSNGVTTLTKQLTVGQSYYSQNSQYLLFGLDNVQESVSITVDWPSGSTTHINNVAVNQTVAITENERGYRKVEAR